MSPEQREVERCRVSVARIPDPVLIRRLVFLRGLRFERTTLGFPGDPTLSSLRRALQCSSTGIFGTGGGSRFGKQNFRHRIRRDKIRRNRQRDRRVHARLRAHGWTVVRIWEHQIKADAYSCVDRIEIAVMGGTNRVARNSPRSTTQAMSARRNVRNNEANTTQRRGDRPYLKENPICSSTAWRN